MNSRAHTHAYPLAAMTPPMMGVDDSVKKAVNVYFSPFPKSNQFPVSKKFCQHSNVGPKGSVAGGGGGGADGDE